MKIQKALSIEVTQQDVEQAIRDLIKKEDPAIVVDEIQFSAKRTGTDTIAVRVDAHFGEADSVPVSQDVTAPVETTEEEVVVEEETEEPAVEPDPSKSLFG